MHPVTLFEASRNIRVTAQTVHTDPVGPSQSLSFGAESAAGQVGR